MKLVADNLAVDRGLRRIIDNVSFALAAGDALIVTGENGVGKSTLLRAIAGLLPLARGTLRLEGAEADTAPAIHMHYLGARNGMKPALTVAENLAFWRDFSGPTGLDVRTAVAELDLAHALDLPFGYLSTGMRRRAAIARLLVSTQPVWIVDEPTSGLDTASAENFVRLARAHLQGGGILIAATHLPLALVGAEYLALKETGRGRRHIPGEIDDPYGFAAEGVR